MTKKTNNLKKQKLVTIVFIGCLLLPLGWLQQSLAVAQDVTSEKQMIGELSGKTLLDFFIERQKQGAGIVAEPVSRYIKSCCESRDLAIKLLRDSDFKVSIISDPKKVKELNKHWKAEPPYDEFIYGIRGSSFARFWDVFASYQLMLFVKDGKVQRVWAHVDRTLP